MLVSASFGVLGYFCVTALAQMFDRSFLSLPLPTQTRVATLQSVKITGPMVTMKE